MDEIPNSRLAVCTAYFNPRKDLKTYVNYLQFRSRIKTRLFTLELVIAPSESDLEGLEDCVIINASARSAMLQRERMINMLLEQVPERYSKIAWVDGNVAFHAENWEEMADALLEKFSLIQLFDSAAEVDWNGNLLHERPGVIKFLTDQRIKSEEELFEWRGMQVNPGLAWAARREVLTEARLPDWYISGGMEPLVPMAALKAWKLLETYAQRTPGLEHLVLDWARRFHRRVDGSVGHLTGRVTRLSQGSTSACDPIVILKAHNFNPHKDLKVNADGVWEWNSEKPLLWEEVAAYVGFVREAHSSRGMAFDGAEGFSDA